MSWLPSILAPGAAWLALLAVPLVVFYFLKLRRTRLRVPSLVLWQQVLADHRVNAPFQRFKRNILLLLQLIVLMLLVLAAMQPMWLGDEAAASRMVVMIDRSASMGALEKAGGQSRLAVALKQARDMVEGLARDEEMAVIGFDRTARQIAAFTGNKRILLDALGKIELADTPSDLGDALRMAQAMSRSASFDRVVLLTDGNLPAKIDFELPFELDYRKLPAGGANIGITALEARRATGGGWDVFAKVQANHDPAAATLELYIDGELVNDEEVVTDAGEGRRIRFVVDRETESLMELRLRPRGFDALEADNRAFIRLTPARPLYAWCPPSMPVYRQALSRMQGVRVLPEEGEDAPGGTFDLVVTDRADDAAEGAVTLRVGLIPPELEPSIKRSSEGGVLIDWRRDHPLLEHVQFGDVVFLDSLAWSDDQRERPLEAAGFEVIAYGRNGPMALHRLTATRADYWLLFHTDRTTLPYRVGFPIMVRNAVQIALHRAGLLEQAGDRTGVLPAVETAPHAAVTVAGPGGLRQSLTADDDGVVHGVAAPRSGWYTFTRDGAEIARIGVSLLQPAETKLAQAERLDLAEQNVEADDEPVQTNRPLWPLLAMAAMAALCIEWWYFQRRPGGLR